MSAVELKTCNTFGLVSRADRVVQVTQEAQLRDLLEQGRNAEALCVLGGGSNVVLKARIPGTLVLMRTRGLKWASMGSGQIQLCVAAGERWHDVVRFSLGRGWSGLENLALIPGLAGAAPIQNIGAYGVELADRLVSLRAMDVRSGAIRTFARDECAFGYRDSRFKQADAGRYIILEIQLCLSEAPQLVLGYPDLRLELERVGCSQPSPVDVAEAVVRVRRRKLPDPRFRGNAGSFFKNPVISRHRAELLSRAYPELTIRPDPTGQIKLSAAQLIDGCGWKGQRRGRVGVWGRQPLVLVNLGGAIAAEVLDLAEAIRRDVLARYGVDLEIEPRIIGQD